MTLIYTALQTTATGIGEIIALLAVILFIFLILIKNVRVVPQANVYVIERLGTYKNTWQTGIHMKIPFIDRIARRISLKERVADFQPQAVITKDNVTMQIDTVIFFQVVDPVLYSYGIENPILAIENLTATTLRNIIGDLELDETLTSRDVINTRMRITLDEATDPWGIKVNRVELKNILPPQDIQTAMERQMKAEREKRESILIAEGQKEAAIRVAEGDKEAAILRADAMRETAIRESEGEAQAILKVQEATARGLQMIKDVQADDALLALRSLDTFAKVADGRATKIIIPSDLQGLAS
ncbi:MAG: SPFH domain-containing protein, partial [Saccharofermentanales bacterium]